MERKREKKSIRCWFIKREMGEGEREREREKKRERRERERRERERESAKKHFKNFTVAFWSFTWFACHMTS